MTLTGLEQVILIRLQVLERQMLSEEPVACGKNEQYEQTGSQKTPVATRKMEAGYDGCL